MTDQPPDDRLAPLLLDPTRLRVVATLAASGEVEFGFVRDRAGLTDSALSKQIHTLAAAELVATRRSRTGARRRVWLHLTTHGRHTLTEHTNALRTIANSADTANQTNPQ